MKVGTDGVLLGAWAHFYQPASILDIGSGSGLISLMMAQRFPEAHVTGIEIERDAFSESIMNIEQAKFKESISIVHSSVQAFKPDKTFDAIICNPPFFVDSLKSPVNQRNLARHTDTLELKELFGSVVNLLKKTGYFAMIYPYEQAEIIKVTAMEYGFYPSHVCCVKGRQELQPKRMLIQFGFDKVDEKLSELVIERERHQYTAEYINLVKDFYLKM